MYPPTLISRFWAVVPEHQQTYYRSLNLDSFAFETLI